MRPKREKIIGNGCYYHLYSRTGGVKTDQKGSMQKGSMHPTKTA